MAAWLNAVRDKFRRSSKPGQMRQPQRQRLGRLAWVEMFESRLYLAAVAWDGGGDGSRWSDPLNWSNDGLPGEADDMTIDFGGNNVQHDAGFDTVHSLITTNPFELAGGTLHVVTTTQVNNSFTLKGGTLSGGR